MFYWRNKYKFLRIIRAHLITYPTPNAINYNWSFGFLTGLFMVIQIITGVLMAIHYTTNVNIVFENMEFIMRDVNYGWLMRYLHANSASFVFICMYAHVIRGIYYQSFIYPRDHLWYSGIILLLLSIITAFIGYVLPWGQMSYWGATVITNLVTAIPFIGNKIVLWIWGGYTVSGVTLVRFFNFHYLFAIILLVLIIIHLALLHESGSSSGLRLIQKKERINFYKFFIYKDLFIFFIFILCFLFIVFYYPNILGHSDNYIKANPLVTPTHIVPEWYFLPFYAVLRSIENKLLGVIAMILSIAVLGILPHCRSYIKNFYMVTSYYWFFWSFCILISLLWVIGMLPAEFPYVNYGKIITFLYFLNFILYYWYVKFLNAKIIAFFEAEDDKRARLMWEQIYNFTKIVKFKPTNSFSKLKDYYPKK
jgi:quinol-cytochrome oxidoreductase complex cytochrome b subunit